MAWRLRLAALASLVALAATLLPAGASADPLGVATVRLDNPSPQANARFGLFVSSAGDINGDGEDDFAVGAPGSGRVYVFSGSDRSLVRVLEYPGDLIGSPCAPTPEALAPCAFGRSLADVGDMNGDGVDDLAVGAAGIVGGIVAPCPIGNPCPELRGGVYIFSGATGSLIHKIESESFPFNVGFAVARLGDVNGDSIPDVGVGAPALSSAGGFVLAFSGGDGSELWRTTTVPPDAVTGISSLGLFLAAIDDLNGDGKRDLVAGAPHHTTNTENDGTAYVLSGADGAVLHVIDPISTPDTDGSGQNFGSRVAAIGDQDGDGIDDIAIGEPGRSDAAGSLLRLFSGATGSQIVSLTLPADERNQPGRSGLGFPIAGVDDKDGDGIDDFWIGAPKTGAVFLMNRYGDVLISQFDSVPGTSFGWGLAEVGAFGGGPGFDVVVGAHDRSVDGVASAGAAFLLCGDTTPPSLSVSVFPNVLSPPNHKYRTVQSTVTVSDAGNPGVSATLLSVTSNEPDNGEADGNTIDDMVIVDQDTLQLRAERSEIGSGRTYTITYEATDACGNTSVAAAIVSVPLGP